MPHYKAVIDDLVAGNRILYDQGVVDGYGHLSARDPRDPEPLPDVARARAGPGGRRRHHGVRHGRRAGPHDDGRPIYSERFIHSEIYKARPDVHSVVHSHSPTVVPFSVTNEPLQADPRAVLLSRGAGVRHPRRRRLDRPADLQPALGKALAEKLGNNSVVLLRGHGNAVVGADRAHRGLPRGLHRGQRQAAAAGQDAGRPDQLSRAGGGRDHGGATSRAIGPATAPTASGSC